MKLQAHTGPTDMQSQKMKIKKSQRTSWHQREVRAMTHYCGNLSPLHGCIRVGGRGYANTGPKKKS
jgi:hypothetical protein